MAQLITITHTPKTFSPVYTDGLFFTVTTLTNYPKFRFVYDLYANNALIFSGKATPNPFGLGIIDVSKILKNYVSNIPLSYYETTPIYTHETFPFSRPLEDNVINYEILIGYEYAADEISTVTGFTGNGELIFDPVTNTFDLDGIVGQPSVSTGVYKTYQATMGVNGRADQQDFNMGPFILSGTPMNQNPTTTGLFLTNSPRTRDIQPTEYYTLGFTNYYIDQVNLSQPYYSQYKFYDFDGNLLDTRQYQNVYSNGGGPMTDCNFVYQSFYNIVPKTDTEYNTLYLGCGPMNIDDFPQDTAQYTVQLFGNFTGSTQPPTPTPSNTPTPTPSVVPCPGCTTYLVENQSPSTGTFRYIDCDSRSTQTYTLPGNSAVQVCACTGSISNLSPGIVYSGSDPCGLQPCASCDSVTIYNNSTGTTAQFALFNCTTNSWATYSLPPQTGNVYCCCSENIYTYLGAIQIIVGPPCNAPTPTPTPTPSCIFRTFKVPLCLGSTCSGGICTCSAGPLQTVYAPCNVTTPFADGAILYFDTMLTNTFNGTFSNGSVIYEAINGFVSIVCVIGGPC